VQAIGPGGDRRLPRWSRRCPPPGSGNPITGVLVVFRNLDTLLEVAVLLAAYLASRAVLGDAVKAALALPPDQDARLVGALVAWWRRCRCWWPSTCCKAGSQLPGGAFQAGATSPPAACC
jgi:hypothetical protein